MVQEFLCIREFSFLRVESYIWKKPNVLVSDLHQRGEHARGDRATFATLEATQRSNDEASNGCKKMGLIGL